MHSFKIVLMVCPCFLFFLSMVCPSSGLGSPVVGDPTQQLGPIARTASHLLQIFSNSPAPSFWVGDCRKSQSPFCSSPSISTLRFVVSFLADVGGRALSLCVMEAMSSITKLMGTMLDHCCWRNSNSNSNCNAFFLVLYLACWSRSVFCSMGLIELFVTYCLTIIVGIYKIHWAQTARIHESIL